MKFIKVASVALSVVLLLSGCVSKGYKIYGFDNLTLEEFKEKYSARTKLYEGEPLKNDDPEFNKKLYDLLMEYKGISDGSQINDGSYEIRTQMNDTVYGKRSELEGYGWNDFNLNTYLPDDFEFERNEYVKVRYEITSDIKSEDGKVYRFIIEEERFSGNTKFKFYYTGDLELNKVMYFFNESNYQEMYNFLMKTFGVDISNDYVEAKRLAVDENGYEASVGNIKYIWNGVNSEIEFSKEFNVSDGQTHTENMIDESSLFNPSKSEITKDLIDNEFNLSLIEFSGTLNREDATWKDYFVKVSAKKEVLNKRDEVLGKAPMKLELYGQMDGDIQSIRMNCEAYGALFYDAPWLNKYSIYSGEENIYLIQYDRESGYPLCYFK